MIKNVIEYFENTVKQYGDKLAIIDYKQELTFFEISQKAKKIAAIIKNIIGVETINKPIVVYMDKSADTIISFLAVLYSGNFYCPIDINMPYQRKKYILDILKPALVIENSNSLDVDLIPVIKITEVYNSSFEFEEKYYSGYKSVLDIDPIYTLFTSGSTGIPKGVVISHRGVIDYTEWLHDKFNFNSETIFGNQAPFYFDNSILDIYSMIKNASTMVIIPEKMFIFPNKLIEYINEKKINTLFWVPSALINVANSGILENIHLKYVRKILFCGEVMPCKQLNIWRKNYPEILYANLYGPTEITDVCSYYVLDREFKDDEVLPIGKACENSEILILNGKNEICKINEDGELCVRGCGVSMGYYSNNDKTEQAFIQNPLNSNYRDIIYRTGDIVHLNENNEIIYVGRKDFQIKHMGHRIELGEIEASLGDLKKIIQSCAIYDEKENKIVIFCVTKDNDEINEKEIYEHMKNKLPKYMLPKSINIINEFPVNLNGKIDRLKLKEMLYRNCSGPPKIT